MSMVKSFCAVAAESAHVLILGSMPSVASLKANQYYAHPRNTFWPILASIYGFEAKSEYASRVQSVIIHGIAIWDVLQSCERLGSLDSAIVNGSRVPNNFGLFFDQHPHIKLICFNGAEAEKSFRHFVLTQIDLKEFNFIRLPSTSPANTQSFEQKKAEWEKALLLAN